MKKRKTRHNTVNPAALPEFRNETLHVADGLGSLLKRAAPADLDNLRALMCQAVSVLAPLPGDVRTTRQLEAFRAIIMGLRRFSSGQLLWRGRPTFVTENLLRSLRREGAALSEQAIRANGHLYHPGGHYANNFAVSKELCVLMSSLVADCSPTGIASYVYYFAQGDGIPPHIDTPMFSLNVLLMLEHQHGPDPSHLLIYEGDPIPKRIYLEPGEMVIFDGSALVHAREKLGAKESISILTVGFSPQKLN